MLKIVRAMVAIAIILAASFAARPAAAENSTWTVTSTYDYKVSIAFYSQQSNRSWPGGDKVWIIADSRAHEYSLACRPGETICYGAWPTGNDGSRYWGVGRDNANHCKSCCYKCGADPNIELD